MKTAAQYNEHAYALAHKFNVYLDLSNMRPPHKAAALAHRRKGGWDVVYAKTITDDTSYAVVLHEMGHCVSELGTLHYDLGLTIDTCSSLGDIMRFLDVQIEAEEAAWNWARHYALEWTTGMQQVEAYAMNTYRTTRERFSRIRL